MRYSIIFFLPLLAAATPMPTQPNNALANGINANLAAGNREVASVKNLQSIEQNHGSAAQVQAGIQSIQNALSTAVAIAHRTRLSTTWSAAPMLPWLLISTRLLRLRETLRQISKSLMGEPAMLRI
jgi:hypothetical protein